MCCFIGGSLWSWLNKKIILECQYVKAKWISLKSGRLCFYTNESNVTTTCKSISKPWSTICMLKDGLVSPSIYCTVHRLPSKNPLRIIHTFLESIRMDCLHRTDFQLLFADFAYSEMLKEWLVCLTVEWLKNECWKQTLVGPFWVQIVRLLECWGILGIMNMIHIYIYHKLLYILHMKQIYVSKSYIQDLHLKKQIKIFNLYITETHIFDGPPLPHQPFPPSTWELSSQSPMICTIQWRRNSRNRLLSFQTSSHPNGNPESPTQATRPRNGWNFDGLLK